MHGLTAWVALMRRRRRHLARQMPTRFLAITDGLSRSLPPRTHSLLHRRAVDRDPLPIAARHPNAVLVPEAAVHKSTAALRCSRQASPKVSQEVTAVLLQL